MTTTYLDRDADQQYESWLTGKCIHCSTVHVAGCLARFCDSCVRYYLADTGDDNGEGLPIKATCAECIALGMGTLEETIAWLRVQGDRIAAETSAEYSAKFDAVASEIVAGLDGKEKAA